MIQNRTFQDDVKSPLHWSLVQDGGVQRPRRWMPNAPLSAALPTALKVEVTQAGQRVGVANDGYWGIPAKPSTRYQASFYAKGAPGFTGPLQVSIESADGSAIFAQAEVNGIGPGWRPYNVTLKTGDVPASASNRFVISSRQAGTFWLNLVSLFPPTWHDRPNGNRVDLMQLLSDMNPAFLRFPGGNYVQGFHDRDPLRLEAHRGTFGAKA